MGAYRALPAAFALLAYGALGAGVSEAGQTELCVKCSEPEASYTCRVNTPRGSPGEKALQLYCIVKTAKEGGHASCAVRRKTGPTCEGVVKIFNYDGPVIPDALRSAAQRGVSGTADSGPDTPPQKGGEPETLIDMGSRAVGASKDGIRATGRAVRNAAGGTGRAIGNVGKKAGQQVSKTARGAKGAARYAYDCVVTLFRDCRRSVEEEETPEPQQ